MPAIERQESGGGSGGVNSSGSLAPKSPSSALVDNPVTEAIRTVFGAEQNGTRAFMQRTTAAIEGCEGELTAAARAGRLQVESALYGAADARDAMSAQQQRLDDAHGSLEATRAAIQEHAALLEERVRVRRNLDAAMGLVAHTRKLIRTYARVEDVIASGRLHTALHMLRTLEADARTPNAAALLAFMYPRAASLRGEISAIANRILESALTETGALHEAAGRYALTHPGWIPASSSSDLEPKQLLLARSKSLGVPGRGSNREVEPASLKLHLEAPTVQLRPLLQCVQVYGDLGRSDELRTTYRRRRERQMRDAVARLETVSSAEHALDSIAGLIVVEKSIANAGAELMEDGVLVKELWRMAHTRIAAALNVMQKAGNASVPLFAIRSVHASLDSFAHTYALPT